MTKDRPSNANAVAQYYDVMSRHLGERVVERCRYQMDFQYRDIEFKGLRVLDIGGGNGIHSFYAAARGAEYVLNLEPEEAGSTAGVVAQFNVWKKELGNPNAKIVTSTFQDYDHEEGPFELIIIQDAINHLDEEACSDLQRNEASRRIYDQLFKKLTRFTHPKTILHFSDCSSYNLFPAIGMRNPFDPAIEWHKHQPPGTWITLLREVGFHPINQRWSTPARLGSTGQRVFGNAFCAYFFTSHFAITMVRK